VTLERESPLPILQLSQNGKYLATLNERELCVIDLLPASNCSQLPAYNAP
jgi:hypothetical protein